MITFESLQLWHAYLATLALAIAYPKACGVASDSGLISRSVARKLMHIGMHSVIKSTLEYNRRHLLSHPFSLAHPLPPFPGTGPIFILCWPLYSPSYDPWSRVLAATVPLSATLYFYLVGHGYITDPKLIQGSSRSGDKEELLGGPLLYGLSHAIICLVSFQTIPGCISILMLCVGDGLAEVVGKRVASPSLPWNKSKTVAGFLGCFLGGTIASLAMIYILFDTEVITTHNNDNNRVVPIQYVVGMVGLGSAVVESVCTSEYSDNIAVPLFSLIASTFVYYYFHYNAT